MGGGALTGSVGWEGPSNEFLHSQLLSYKDEEEGHGHCNPVVVCSLQSTVT